MVEARVSGAGPVVDAVAANVPVTAEVARVVVGAALVPSPGVAAGAVGVDGEWSGAGEVDFKVVCVAAVKELTALINMIVEAVSSSGEGLGMVGSKVGNGPFVSLIVVIVKKMEKGDVPGISCVGTLTWFCARSSTVLAARNVSEGIEFLLSTATARR